MDTRSFRLSWGVLLGCVLASGCATTPPADSVVLTESEPGPEVTGKPYIEAIEGDGLAVIASQKGNREVEVGAELEPGMGVRTGKGTTIKLRYPDGSVVLVGRSTQIEILDPPTMGVRSAEILRGRVRGLIKKPRDGAYAPKHRYLFRSKTGVMGVRGTDFLVEGSEKSLTTWTLSGAVEVARSEAALAAGGKGVVTVATNQAVTANPKEIEPVKFYEREALSKETWSEQPGFQKLAPPVDVENAVEILDDVKDPKKAKSKNGVSVDGQKRDKPGASSSLPDGPPEGVQVIPVIHRAPTTTIKTAESEDAEPIEIPSQIPPRLKPMSEYNPVKAAKPGGWKNVAEPDAPAAPAESIQQYFSVAAFQFGGLLIYSSYGLGATGFASWNPTFMLPSLVGLRLHLGLTHQPLRTSGYQTAGDVNAMVVFAPFEKFAIQGGYGRMLWFGQGPEYPYYWTGYFALRGPKDWTFERVFLEGDYIISKDVVFYQLKAGIGLKF